MISLLLTMVVVVVICGVAAWVLGQLVPGHPPIIDALIWVLCVLLVLYLLVGALGIADIPLPRLR